MDCTEQRPITVGSTLHDHLTAAKRKAITFLTNTEGNPWTSDGFRALWSKACEQAGIDDVTFHDIRGSAVTRLALAGASVPEIASPTATHLKDAEEIFADPLFGTRCKAGRGRDAQT
ncbi:tyrosine-type recombinase/integrase [Microvirga sp. ACRRW]|uniref:tyrosine-type recombinase/integrase n=1 Tax=Microvirga sp. ACRRW TaxID=2918205 RepID=UPI001EF4B223|nr:tyrosine-type recombinase/integrase [Microvirga sp. ACRRW]MCG7391645.1 tyrosine-type recombinase/integrase [Microvirga sp. ACRRW]